MRNHGALALASLAQPLEQTARDYGTSERMEKTPAHITSEYQSARLWLENHK